MTGDYRLLNRFVCHNLEPRGRTSNVNQKNGYLLYTIGTGKSINVPLVIVNGMLRMLNAAKNATLPYGVLITQFLMYKGVIRKTNEETMGIQNPINNMTLEYNLQLMLVRIMELILVKEKMKQNKKNGFRGSNRVWPIIRPILKEKFVL